MLGWILKMLGGFRSVNIIELLALQNNRLPVSLSSIGGRSWGLGRAVSVRQFVKRLNYMSLIIRLTA